MERRSPPFRGSQRRCYTCKRPGHVARNCPDVRCYRCQQLGHVARNCPGPPGSKTAQSSIHSEIKKLKVSHSPPQTVIKAVPHAGHTQSTRQHQRSIQTSQGTSQPQGSVLTTQYTSLSKTPIDEAENFWLQSVHDWYPYLHSQTYFLPPLHFNRVPYGVNIDIAPGLPVLVPQLASDQIGQTPVHVPSGPPPQSNPPPLASQLYQPVPPGDPLRPVYDSDVRDDRALQQVLQRLQQLAERRQEVMMVLSQLDFRKYLDNQVNPITTAAIHMLPRPVPLGYQYGDFDVVIISRAYGLIVGEVKSVGDNPRYTTDQKIVQTVQKAVKQLKKADVILRQLVSDLAPVNVTRILMLPNITSERLMTALSTDPQTEQDLCQCVGATDTATAVARCLCADGSDKFWERSVTDQGMSPELYERLVARFCGPATSIEVPTVTPRRSIVLRTLTQAIAHTGLRMVILTLYPEQVDLINRRRQPFVFLWGPPGTGKTLILYLKAVQWRHQGKDVHLLSSHKGSRAANLLLEHQLQHAPGVFPTATPADVKRVHRHMYDFDNEGEVKKAVQELAAAAIDGELFVVVDEVYCYSISNKPKTTGRFSDFVDQLRRRVPKLCLWAAAIECVLVPQYMPVENLTRPLRCPPVVIREVEKSRYFDDEEVLKYSSIDIPVPTEGPAVRTLQHCKRSDYALSPLPGHTAILPEDCERCGHDIADLLKELRIGQSGQDLAYRDVIILCYNPDDSLPVVSRLRARGMPVLVVKSDDENTAIRDVALAESDTIVLTDWRVVRGLERRAVIVMNGPGIGDFRLHEMSRCTSFLACFDIPQPHIEYEDEATTVTTTVATTAATTNDAACAVAASSTTATAAAATADFIP